LALAFATQFKYLSSTPLELHFRAHFLQLFLRGLLGSCIFALAIIPIWSKIALCILKKGVYWYNSKAAILRGFLSTQDDALLILYLIKFHLLLL
jgi:hypothetical protein